MQNTSTVPRAAVRFLEWANAQLKGNVLASLRLDFDVTGGKGFRVLADAELARHTKVLVIPPSLWVPCSAFVAMQDMQANAPQLVRRVQSQLGDGATENVTQMVALATGMAMHWEGHLTSPHDPYYHFCNECVAAHAHPLLRSEHDLGLIKGTNAYDAVQKRRNFYRALMDGVFGTGSPLTQPLLRATSLILSRAVSGKSMPFTLVPVMDLFNHGRAHNCSHTYDKSTDSFVVETTRDIRAGEELLINYGELRDSVSMFCVYGFVEPDNPNDQLQLSLKGEAQQSANALLDNALERFHLGADKQSHICEIKRANPEEDLSAMISVSTMPYLRVCALEETQLLNPAGIDPWRRISAENEQLAIQRLLHLATVGIATRQSSAADADGHDKQWAELCRLIRDAEITLLQQVVQRCENALARK